MTQIESTIRGLRQDPYGKYTFTLEDGARWVQIDTREMRATPRLGQPIRIRRAMMGSYLANVNDQIAIRVRRVLPADWISQPMARTTARSGSVSSGFQAVDDQDCARPVAVVPGLVLDRVVERPGLADAPLPGFARRPGSRSPRARPEAGGPSSARCWCRCAAGCGCAARGSRTSPSAPCRECRASAARRARAAVAGQRAQFASCRTESFQKNQALQRG